MDRDYWHRQSTDELLYPNMLWSQPENKLLAGKLAVIGGNIQGFAAAAEAYQYAQSAGIGIVRVLLPDSLQKTVGRVFEVGEYAPSTPSGSFSQRGLAEMVELAQWSDGSLIAGDLARNSETAVLIEQFTAHYTGQLTYTKDAVDYLMSTPHTITSRPNTLLVINFAQLQRLATTFHFDQAFISDMGLLRFIDALRSFNQQYGISTIIKYMQNFIVASEQQISTTRFTQDLPKWRVQLAAYGSVWWLQNPTKSFEALSTAVAHLLLNVS